LKSGGAKFPQAAACLIHQQNISSRAGREIRTSQKLRRDQL
jgi:hypothetical protein